MLQRATSPRVFPIAHSVEGSSRLWAVCAASGTVLASQIAKATSSRPLAWQSLYPSETPREIPSNFRHPGFHPRERRKSKRPEEAPPRCSVPEYPRGFSSEGLARNCRSRARTSLVEIVKLPEH